MLPFYVLELNPCIVLRYVRWSFSVCQKLYTWCGVEGGQTHPSFQVDIFFDYNNSENGSISNQTNRKKGASTCFEMLLNS